MLASLQQPAMCLPALRLQALRRHTLLAWVSGMALVLLMLGTAWAQDVLPVPALTGRVMDQANVLSPAERAALEQKLAAFEAQAGPQIVLLLVASTTPEDITSYAQRVADSWKIGRRAVGDGLLLVVARDDRKLRIEVAKALEGAVPDLAARQIIDRAITPAFKRGDYAGGLNAGVDSLMARLRGEGLPAPAAPGRQGGGGALDGLDWQTLAMFLFVGVPVVGGVLSAVLGRKLGAVATAGGTGALAFWLSTSLLIGGIAGVVALLLVGVMGVGGGRGRSGGLGVPPIIFGGGGFGGRGGGGGGGFRSGGGGDFGGGGASGGW